MSNTFQNPFRERSPFPISLHLLRKHRHIKERERERERERQTNARVKYNQREQHDKYKYAVKVGCTTCIFSHPCFRWTTSLFARGICFFFFFLLSSFFFFFCVTKKKTLKKNCEADEYAFVCFFIQFFSLLYRALFSLSLTHVFVCAFSFATNSSVNSSLALK